MKREPMEAGAPETPSGLDRAGPHSRSGSGRANTQKHRTMGRRYGNKSGEGSLLWSVIHNEEEGEGRSHVVVNREEEE